MQIFVGTVTHLRSAAISSQTGSYSSLNNDTALRFGEHSMTLTTGKQPAIHPGDHLRVYGYRFLGTVRPIYVRNDANGYEAGLVSKGDMLKAALAGPALGFGLLFLGGVNWLTLAIALGLSVLPVSAVAGVRSYASSAIRRSMQSAPASESRSVQPS